MKLSAHMGWLGRLGFYGLVLILQPAAGHGADSGSGSTAQGAVVLPGAAPAGAGLTLEDVVRITLENQSSIKSAAYQTKAQDAVLHQQMAAYYPEHQFEQFLQYQKRRRKGHGQRQRVR